MAKIMIFDERIDSFDEKIFAIKPEMNFCDYCGQFKKTRIKIHNMAFINLQNMCDDCAMVYYGGMEIRHGFETLGESFTIPVDPLLEYLDKIDPIPCPCKNGVDR